MQDEHGNFPDWGKESGAAGLGSSSPTIMLGGGPLRSYNSYSVSDTVNVVGASSVFVVHLWVKPALQHVG